jgi:serine/threonine protein kinase/Tfp pilus assembly protein PilF
VPIKCPRCSHENPDNTNYCGKCSASLDTQVPAGEARTKTVAVRDLGLKTGTILAGRYEIIEPLGRGGMGKVYKAHDLEVNEDIALKVIRPEIADNPRIIQRFQNELKLARKISHRNVCRMFDLGRDGATQYITMEFVPGEDLRTTIRRIGPVTVRKAVDIGEQICQGLSEAHGLGIIHRDLKPSNIIIDTEGNVRIMDFGIALSRETEGVTDPGVVPGTLQYVAPELLAGAKPSASSDIYSLGVILYEMVTGRLPIEKDPTPGTAGKSITGTLKEPTTLNHEIPAALSRLILKCLAKDPAKRFHNAEEVCAELNGVRDELPAPEEGSWLRRLWDKILSKPKLKWSLAIGLPLALAAVIIAMLMTPPPPPEKSLIVLPFKHLKMKDTQKDIALNVLVRIIRNLARSPELKIIPYEASIKYTDAALSDKTISAQSAVGNILKGTISSNNGGIDIDVRLLQRSGKILLSESFPCKSDMDIDAALGKIAEKVAEKLGVKIPEAAPLGPSKPEPVDPQAFKYYHYALLDQEKYFKAYRVDDFNDCVKNYQKALDFEPGCTIIYWQLGAVYETKYNRDKKDGDEKLMLYYWEQAYIHDPNLAEANLAMGWVHFNREEHELAFSFFKRAMELDGDSADVNFHVGSFLRSLGLYVQARKHYARALAIRPVPGDFAVWHQLLADCDIQLGEVREAADLLRTAMELSDDSRITLDLAVCLLKLKDFAEAEKQIAKAVQEGAQADDIRRHKALWYAATGNRDAALALMRDEAGDPTHLVISIYALLRMKSQVIQGIQAASGSQGFQRFRWYRFSYLALNNNPFFENLRDDPEFQSIVQAEKARYEEWVKKLGDL